MAKDFDIAKAADLCCRCGKQMQPTEEFFATVREAGDLFVREDHCLTCWEGNGQSGEEGPSGPEGLFGVWRTRVPTPEEKKKKLLVDDDLIVNFFERLEGADSPAKLSYRFVLALVLMRKRRLVYDRTTQGADGRDVWQMHFRGDPTPREVIDPHMDEDKIAEVSQQLGEVMQGEFE